MVTLEQVNELLKTAKIDNYSKDLFKKIMEIAIKKMPEKHVDALFQSIKSSIGKFESKLN